MAWICFEIAAYLTSKKRADWEGAILVCKQGMKKIPKDPILPVLLSNLYAESGWYESALQTEAHVIREFSENTH
jgi:hypothetical protein